MAWARGAVALLAAAIPTFNAWAQSSQPKDQGAAPPPVKPYSVMRWDEDYSYLKNPAFRRDYVDPIKYISIGDDSYLSLGGHARYRYEYFNNNTLSAGPQDEDGYHLTRFFLYGDLHVGQNLRFFVEGKSSMEDDREGGPLANQADEADLQQAFVDVRTPLGEGSRSLTLRAGRWEMSYGAQRLIAANDWSNVHNAFEGGKVSLTTGSNLLDVFWVRPIVVNKEEPNDGDGNRSFEGVYDTLALPGLIDGANCKLELYALGLNAASGPTVVVDSDTYTLGTRFSGAPRPWDFDVEADWQFGQFADQPLAAYSLALEGGYTFADLLLAPRLFLGFDVASGSADGSERFNQLFPSVHHYFGYIDLFARQNIIDLHPGVTLALTRTLSFRAEEHIFWRQNINDALYNGQRGVLRADNGSDAAYVGNEIDLLLNWQISRHLSAYAGYSHFFAGDFIQQTGPSQDEDFLYAAIAYTF